MSHVQQIVERCMAYAHGDYAGLVFHKFPVPNRNREDILMYGDGKPTRPSSGL